MCSVLGWVLSCEISRADDVATQIQAVLKVDKEGVGHDAAVSAVKVLVQQPASTLIPLLEGMDSANPLAANWLRGAFEAIAERQLRSGTPLPAKDLEQFALDRSHAAAIAPIGLRLVRPSRSSRIGSPHPGHDR